MVSGFLTSPCDHSRILSGEAKEIRIAEKRSGSLGFSKKLKISFTGFSLWGVPQGGQTPPPVNPTRLRRGLFDELDVESQALELLQEHVEGLRQPRVQRVLSFDDG